MIDADFSFLQSFLLRRSGAALWAEKRYVADLRLGALVAEHHFADVSVLLADVRRQPDGELAARVVEAMTTNETFFFRDSRPFQHIETVLLPQLAAARRDRKLLRIWCAAVSSGQEAYSLAILVARQAALLSSLRVEIVATDISREMIEKARAGRYSHFEVQRGLPIQCLLDNFSQDGETWVIAEPLRRAVDFRVMNLLQDAPGLGQFDLILLRNVLIHLDMAVKADVLARAARHLAPDGLLLLGSAESALGLGDAVMPHPEHRGFYARTSQAPSRYAVAERR
ncbi:MAG: protein-glutamate O-methyltransferase CheR [Alsobacter sp.]